MIVKYGEFGEFEFMAEDGKDILWLKTLIENANKEDGEFLVDMEDDCTLENGRPATDIDFATTRDKNGDVFGSLKSIRYNPFGF